MSVYAEPPTLKQENFAERIASVLRIEMPKDKTKQTYSNFISANLDAFNREQQRRKPYYDDFTEDSVGHLFMG